MPPSRSAALRVTVEVAHPAPPAAATAEKNSVSAASALPFVAYFPSGYDPLGEAGRPRGDAGSSDEGARPRGGAARLHWMRGIGGGTSPVYPPSLLRVAPPSSSPPHGEIA